MEKSHVSHTFLFHVLTFFFTRVCVSFFYLFIYLFIYLSIYLLSDTFFSFYYPLLSLSFFISFYFLILSFIFYFYADASELLNYNKSEERKMEEMMEGIAATGVKAGMKVIFICLFSFLLYYF